MYVIKSQVTKWDTDVDDTIGRFVGYASVFNVIDHHNDIILPKAFDWLKNESKPDVKLLWQHHSHEPIGIIERFMIDEHGLRIEGKLTLEVAKAMDAYNLLREGAISGLSIGFQVKKAFYSNDKKRRYIEDLNLFEISLVTFPANKEAEVFEVKNLENYNNSGVKLMTTTNNDNLQIQFDQLQNEWHQYKELNDRILKSHNKLAADPLDAEALVKISDRINSLETALSRSTTVVKSENLNVENKEHEKAFSDYLRKGLDLDLSRFEAKSLSANSDPNGGYLMTSTVSNQIYRNLETLSPFRDLVSVEMISSDALDIIVEDGRANSGWVAEQEERGDTNTASFNKIRIPVHEIYAQPKATQKLLDDAKINVENWLADSIAESFAKTENHAFINGDAKGKPHGLLMHEDGKEYRQIEHIYTGKSGEITADALFNLYYALKSEYSARASFILERSTLHKLRSLKDKNGQYIWNPSLQLGTPQTLLGVPVVEIAEMPMANADAKAIVLGDFKTAYKIVDRAGIRTMRDPFTEKPFVKFYSTKRVGGGVVNFEALKILQLS